MINWRSVLGRGVGMDSSTLNIDEMPLFRESDRGSVIVGVAILDSSITEYLRAVIKKNGLSNRYVAKIFDGNGALGTFSSKVQISRGFSLIDENVFHDLMVLRKMRNEFAHVEHSCSFTDKKVISQIDSLKTFQRLKKYFQQDDDGAQILKLLEDGNEKAYKYFFCLVICDIKAVIAMSRARYFDLDVSDLDHLRPDCLPII